MIHNQKGQTSIEALLAIPLMVLFIFMVIVFFTSARSFFWAQYQLHEAVVCLQDQSRVSCTNQIKNKMKRYLTFWRIESVKLNKGISFDSGQMILTSSFFKKISLEIEKRVFHE
jgi:uncharacterized protein (UPF0333 family)